MPVIVQDPSLMVFPASSTRVYHLKCDKQPTFFFQPAFYNYNLWPMSSGYRTQSVLWAAHSPILASGSPQQCGKKPPRKNKLVKKSRAELTCTC